MSPRSWLGPRDGGTFLETRCPLAGGSDKDGDGRATKTLSTLRACDLTVRCSLLQAVQEDGEKKT